MITAETSAIITTTKDEGRSIQTVIVRTLAAIMRDNGIY
jgi:hypothetical protein